MCDLPDDKMRQICQYRYINKRQEIEVQKKIKVPKKPKALKNFKLRKNFNTSDTTYNKTHQKTGWELISQPYL